MKAETSGSAMVRVGEQYAMPASIVQERIWVRSYQSKDSSWNVAVRFMLSGALSVEALEAALCHVASQNEILRTCFTRHGANLTQMIHPLQCEPIAIVDLGGMSEAEHAAELQNISSQEASKVFDLQTAPLWRVLLIRLRLDKHVLLLTMHHIISDGWSIGLFSGQLMDAYGKALQGALDSVGDSLPQYADYSVWFEQRRLTSEYREHSEFWKRTISEGLTARRTYLPRMPHISGHSEIQSMLLPLDLTNRVKETGRQSGATFYQVALSAFVILRAMQQDNEQVVIGTPVSGRESMEAESIIGPFVNYIPLTLHCTPEMSVDRLVSLVANTMAEVLAHSEYRYEDMLRDAGTDLDPFECVFICQRDFVHAARRGGVEISAIPSTTAGCLYDLTFFLVEREDGWRLSCEVNTAKYDAEQARNMLETYRSILIEIVCHPGRSIRELRAQMPHPVANEEAVQHALREDGTDRMSSGSVSLASSVVEYPASAVQLQYWLLDQSRSDKTTFYLRIRLMVEGKFNPVYVREALGYLVRRHDILRTTFTMEGDHLRQRVHDAAFPVNYEYRSKATIPEEQQESAIKDILEVESRWQCSLEDGPLLRTLHVDLGNDRALLSITLAHLIADGWSCGVLQKEFEHAYRAFSNGETPKTTELAMQYGDAALLENSWLESGEAHLRSEYWKDRLHGQLRVLDLPADVQANPVDSAKGAIECVPIDPKCDAQVHRRAKEFGTTPFVVYGAVFQALLFRYCSVPDITFSTPFANRTQETEAVIGPFATPVLLRSSIGRDWTIRDYFESLRDAAMDAFDHMLPLERYAEGLALSLRGSRHPLNQLCFFYQRAFVRASQSEGLMFTPLPASPAGAAFEWQLSIIEREGGITAEFQYDAALYSRETIRMALRHYLSLISQCLTLPETPITEFAFATDEEIKTLAQGGDLLPISRCALSLPPIAATETSPRTSDVVDVDPGSIALSKMIELWEKVFRRSGLGPDTNFFEIGGYSLMLARLQALVRKEFDVDIRTEHILSNPTIASLTKRLIQNQAPELTTRNPRVIPIHAEGNQPPLFLISQSMIFRRMAEHLGPDQPVFAIQMQEADLAGCGANPSFVGIAEFYASLIREAHPAGPYRVGGWCVAGWLAYEVAQLLQAGGGEVELLVIVDAWAPGYWRDMVGRPRLLAKANYYWSRLKLHTRTLTELPLSKAPAFLGEHLGLNRKILAYVTASWFGSAKVPPGVVIEDPATLVDQQTYRASRTYRPRPTLIATLLFRSSEQPTGPFLAKDMGWGKLLGGSPHIITLTGEHRQIFDDPGAAVLAGEIISTLSNIAAREDSERVGVKVSDRAASVLGHSRVLRPEQGH